MHPQNLWQKGRARSIRSLMDVNKILTRRDFRDRVMCDCWEEQVQRPPAVKFSCFVRQAFV